MANILVVDDEPSILSALRKILTKFGHEVLEAKEGGEALDKFREDSPDIVITDLYMPGIDGMEATIRLMAEFPEAKVIAMSGGGWQDKGTVLENMEGLGVAATLEKPFSVEEVMEVIDRVLGDAA